MIPPGADENSLPVWYRFGATDDMAMISFILKGPGAWQRLKSESAMDYYHASMQDSAIRRSASSRSV